jgi:hypothetical protein
VPQRKKEKEIAFSQALVAHGCNPSYSGKDQDCGSKPAWARSLRDAISKKKKKKKHKKELVE